MSRPGRRPTNGRTGGDSSRPCLGCDVRGPVTGSGLRIGPSLRIGCDKLKATPPGSAYGLYYDYYATQVMHHMGGDYWDFWNEGPKGKGSRTGMRDILIKRQGIDGSWDPASDAHGSSGGRIMVTSLSLLTLEVYYRHLPLYQRVNTTKK